MLISTAMFFAACGGGGAPIVADDGNNTGGGGTGGGGGATGSANLSWQIPTTNSDGSSLTDLSGYRIYQGTSQSTANLSPIVTLTNASLSMYLVENLGTGTYYFSITAMNSQNIESNFSNLAQVTIN